MAEKLEQQINEAEAERLLSKWLTKRTVLTLIATVSLAYIWYNAHVSHAYVPQGPAIAPALVLPTPVKPTPPPNPSPVIVNDPRTIPAGNGLVQPDPPNPNAGAANPGQPQSKEDPVVTARNARMALEHESAFASMLAPEEKGAASPGNSITVPNPGSQQQSHSEHEKADTIFYVIPRGTSAPLAVDSRLGSENGGPVDAHFTSDLYLPGTRTLIIPKGSKVLGDSTALNGMGQRRLAVTFEVIQRDPVDRSCDIHLVSPALDEAGSTGLTGSVKSHLGSALLGSSLAAVLQGASMGVLYSSGGSYGPTQVIVGNTAASASQTTARLLDKFIQLPTVTVQEGSRADFPFIKDTPVSACGATNHDTTFLP